MSNEYLSISHNCYINGIKCKVDARYTSGTMWVVYVVVQMCYSLATHFGNHCSRMMTTCTMLNNFLFLLLVMIVWWNRWSSLLNLHLIKTVTMSKCGRNLQLYLSGFAIHQAIIYIYIYLWRWLYFTCIYGLIPLELVW